jgi:hypothetical protein
MFIPNVQKEVIERRRLQHILLMLLRMLIFLLLAFAFARPILKSSAAVVPTQDRARHVILVDQSLSMQTLDWLNEAKSEARKILDSVGADAEVAVVAFADRPTLLSPLRAREGDNASGVARARSAIDEIEPTQEMTNYLAAMRRAQEVLLQSSEENPSEGYALTLHLVTDFQKAGMPRQAEGWKLSPRIQFNPVQIGEGPAPNVSITALGLTVDSQGRLRLRAQVKNWIDATARSVDVALMTGGEATETKTVEIPPGNAARVLFELSSDQAKEVSGWLQIPDDALGPDNRRYFAWSAPAKVRTLILGDAAEGERWPAAWLFQQALPNGPDAPWSVDTCNQSELAAKLESDTPPRLIVAAGLLNFTAETEQRLLDFVENGGRLLLTLGPNVEADAVNGLLNRFNVASDGLMYDELAAYRFSVMAWVDLDHPVFIRFRGAQFNNFSHLKFFNHHVLRVTDESAAFPLARFESERAAESPPAMIETSLGEGRAVIWSFTADLGWTDFPKTPRFVPVLHETLAHLSNLNEVRPVWTVGDNFHTGASVATTGDPAPVADQASAAAWTDEGRFTRAGLMTWQPPTRRASTPLM